MAVRIKIEKPFSHQEIEIEDVSFVLEPDTPHSVEIGETSKGLLYLKSIKFYYGEGMSNEQVVERIFDLYNRIKEEIAGSTAQDESPEAGG